MGKALLEQRHSLLKFVDIVCILIVKDMLASAYLQTEGVCKLTVAVHIVTQTSELLNILSNTRKGFIDGCHSLVAMCHSLVNNLQRKFADVLLGACCLHIDVVWEVLIDWQWCAMLFCNILNEFLSVWTTALIEAWIYGVLVWINKL